MHSYILSNKGLHEEWDSKEIVKVTMAATSCLKRITH